MTDLTHLKLGDLIAVASHERNLGYTAPRISNRIYRVTKRTPTQAEATNIYSPRHSIRVRVSDGKVIGENYINAMAATPEIIEQHEQQVALRKRWEVARARLSDLEGKHFHQLKLTVEQLEVLADAWVRVQAMGQGSTT